MSAREGNEREESQVKHDFISANFFFESMTRRSPRAAHLLFSLAQRKASQFDNGFNATFLTDMSDMVRTSRIQS